MYILCIWQTPSAPQSSDLEPHRHSPTLPVYIGSHSDAAVSNGVLKHRKVEKALASIDHM